MASRDLPATITDDRLRGPETEVIDRGDHRVIRTPGRPGYHNGNQLSLDAAPAAAALPAWFARCRAALAALPVERLRLSWEVAGDAAVGPAQTVYRVLTAAACRPAAAVPGLRIARLAPDDDAGWAAVVGLHADDGADLGAGYAAFVRGHVAAYRRCATREPAAASTWTAWLDDTLVAACMRHEAADWIRVEEVVTAAPWRRRGIAAALCATAFTDAATRHPAATLLIVAENDDATRLYQRLGFTVVGRQASVEQAPG
ncbi:MAG: GNAT family N-acetyltransferase [Kofleriaceae bacterium]|nr:GNAT family N-acetyltransferase [Kofleriaceae bacterium]